jgi:hypothetical protein
LNIKEAGFPTYFFKLDKYWNDIFTPLEELLQPLFLKVVIIDSDFSMQSK